MNVLYNDIFEDWSSWTNGSLWEQVEPRRAKLTSRGEWWSLPGMHSYTQQATIIDELVESTSHSLYNFWHQKWWFHLFSSQHSLLPAVSPVHPETKCSLQVTEVQISETNAFFSIYGWGRLTQTYKFHAFFFPERESIEFNTVNTSEPFGV